MGTKTRLLVMLICFFGFLFSLTGPVVLAEEPPDPDSFTAEGIILMDAKTGEILYRKNETKPLYPASITKIMTAILALESDRLDEDVVVSERARYVDGSRIYLSEGERKPLLDLVYGMMLNSGNDAAVAIAEHLGGSVEQFAEMMNEKAKALGAHDTHFVNPNGLPDEEHVTTALDMANIARYALQNSLFREIVTTKTMPWNGQEWQSTLINTNEMLWDYEGMTGIKTGYTHAAGQTYVGSAQRGETELIVVLLKAQSRPQLWIEAETLLNYGFEHFETVKVHEKGELVRQERDGQEHVFKVEQDVYLTLDKSKASDVQWSERMEWSEAYLPLLKELWTSYYVIEKNGKEEIRVPLSYQFSRLVHEPGAESVAAQGEGAKPGVKVLSQPDRAVKDAALEPRSFWSGWVKGITIFVVLVIVLLFMRRRRRKK
jgi:D-alanyl-D-alanine carboxypeptidase (penicillin-binding protein 5/6)